MKKNNKFIVRLIVLFFLLVSTILGAQSLYASSLTASRTTSVAAYTPGVPFTVTINVNTAAFVKNQIPASTGTVVYSVEEALTVNDGVATGWSVNPLSSRCDYSDVDSTVRCGPYLYDDIGGLPSTLSYTVTPPSNATLPLKLSGEVAYDNNLPAKILSSTGAQTTIVDKAAPVTYTVSASASPAGSATLSGAGTYNSGLSVTVSASPDVCYTFVNWTEGGSQVSTSASYNFNISGNRTLVANSALKTFTVSTSSSPSAGGSTSGGGTKNCGSSATVTASPASGYAFVNWTEGGSPVSNSASYTFAVSGNRTLVANFSQNTYTVSASASPAGSATLSGAGTYNSGSSVTVSASPDVCYTFVNWTEGGSQVSTSASYNFNISGNRTLVANSALKTFTVSTSSSPSAGGSTSGGGTKNCGSSATVTASPASGYAFVNWTEGGSPVSNSASYTFAVSGNRTLVANFSQNTYTVSASASPAGSATLSGAGTYNSGSSVTVSASPDVCYTFVNWTEGGSQVSTSASYNFNISGNRTLVANSALKTFTVSTSSSPSAGGSTSGGGTKNCGSSATVTASPASGYAFVNWTEGGSPVSNSASYTFAVSGNRTLVANFSQNTYTVSASASPAGSATLSGAGTYNSGSSVTVSASPDVCYTFVNWTEGGSQVSTSASYNFNISGNRTLVANSALKTFTVSTSSSPSAGGSTSGGGTKNCGSSATVTASPASGYAFVNWTEGGSPVSNSASYTFAVSGNRTLVANFSQNTLNTSLTITKSGTGTGSVTSSPTGISCGTDCTEAFAQGSSIVLNATPDTGSTFNGWSGACSGMDYCLLQINGIQNVGAVFNSSSSQQNNPPYVNITSPASGITVKSGTILTINADASDDVGVRYVQFFKGTTSLGQDSTAPYSINTKKLSVGTYTFTAKAFDDKTSTTSAPIAVNVVRKLLTTRLFYGMTHPDVIILQELLNETGYDSGTVDGVFGIKTLTAVMAFQEHYKGEILLPYGLLNANGIVTEATLNKINQLITERGEEE